MILHHLVFTFLPVTAELGTIILVLTRLAPPAFLVLFCGALLCYAAAFAYAAATISAAAKTASAAHVDANAAMTDGIASNHVPLRPPWTRTSPTSSGPMPRPKLPALMYVLIQNAR